MLAPSFLLEFICDLTKFLQSSWIGSEVCENKTDGLVIVP